MTLVLLSLFCILPNKYEIAFNNRNILVESERIEFQDYVSLKPVAELLNLYYVLDNTTQRLYLSAQNRKLVLIGNISTITYNGFSKNMPFAPLFIYGDIYFPANEIIPTIGGIFEKLIFIKEIKEAPLINKMSLLTRGDSTVLKFNWNRTIDFDVQFLLNRVVVEIDGRYKKKDKLKPLGAIKSAKLIPYTTYTRLEFDVEDINAFLERENEVVFYHKISKKVNLIVIDPGHGGIDPGAVGKKGLYEKDANLAIAKYLDRLIKDSLGIKIIMTREKDIYLSLKARTSIANSNSADLFVSIHCNASAKSSKMKGFETYFLSEARTTEARAVAMRENASLKFDGIEPTDVVSDILIDLAQTAHLEESNRFAEFIQDNAKRQLPISSRGVKQAGFYVLRGAFMPSILIECAFVSNLEEEKLLKQKSFRKKLAYCIFCGIKNFIYDYERRLNR
ncbi:N-acetylmuramoyl-L-alanine amidase [candidate division WOR-3 bacterium]|nr:N-acetylmuramoyl-L-alanine amidase [candidate division WOR-3 bacterium]